MRSSSDVMEALTIVVVAFGLALAGWSWGQVRELNLACEYKLNHSGVVECFLRDSLPPFEPRDTTAGKDITIR